MDPSSSRSPAQAGLQVYVADAAWRRMLGDAERVVRRAGAVSSLSGSVVLASDRAVKRLNAQFRGRNKPTNVLTFEPNGPGEIGEIVLASGVVAREARAAGKSVRAHLAHLVIHGALHLRGHGHEGAGEARRMEMVEARLLGRLGLPNPWKRT